MQKLDASRITQPPAELGLSIVIVTYNSASVGFYCVGEVSVNEDKASGCVDRFHNWSAFQSNP